MTYLANLVTEMEEIRREIVEVFPFPVVSINDWKNDCTDVRFVITLEDGRRFTVALIDDEIHRDTARLLSGRVAEQLEENKVIVPSIYIEGSDYGYSFTILRLGEYLAEGSSARNATRLVELVINGAATKELRSKWYDIYANMIATFADDELHYWFLHNITPDDIKLRCTETSELFNCERVEFTDIIKFFIIHTCLGIKSSSSDNRRKLVNILGRAINEHHHTIPRAIFNILRKEYF